jgi:hypothetical protein
VTRILNVFLCSLIVFPALGQNRPSPTLAETLQWLQGTSGKESGDGNDRIVFENDGGCSVSITETRVKASPKFWIKNTFSLKDIDPSDITIHPFPEDRLSMIHFHTSNYADKILASSNELPDPSPSSEYYFETTEEFAPRFVKALKHAAELCGAKPSAF